MLILDNLVNLLYLICKVTKGSVAYPDSLIMADDSSSSKRVFNIASIPGDGIGTEITAAAIKVLNQLATTFGTFEFDFHELDWSSKNYLARGWYMPDDGLQNLKSYDAIYFGAVGWPDVPDHVSVTSEDTHQR